MRASGARRDDGPLDWPMPRWYVWGWSLIVVGWWAFAGARDTTRGGEPPISSIALAAGARIAVTLVEAAWYVVAWRSLGRRLPFGWFAAWLLSLSLLDLMAGSLRGLAGRHPEIAPWLAPLAGIGLLPGVAGWDPGLRVAFGPLGLLTLARIVLASLLQARAARVPLAGALGLTAATWLATRVALWWTADLVRGMSPIP